MSSKHLPTRRTKPVLQFRSARLLPWIFAASTTSVVALLLAAGAAHAAGPTQAELNNAVNDSANWLYVDHDYRGQRYTPLDQITAKNAADLVQVCSYTFPDKEPSQTGPVAYDGILYATSAHHTVAVDGASCKPVWRSDWKPRDHEEFVTQRGAAIKDGKVVRGTPDGYLLAWTVRPVRSCGRGRLRSPAKVISSASRR